MQRRLVLALAVTVAVSACTGGAATPTSTTAASPPPPAVRATPAPTPAPDPEPGPPPTGALTTLPPKPTPSTVYVPPIEIDPELQLRFANPGPVDMRSNPFAPRDLGAFPDVFAAHLYRVLPPTFTLIPELAADDEPPPAVFDGSAWVIEVALNPGLTWSDGDPIDAFDLQFTFEDLVHYGDPADLGWAVEDPNGTADLMSVIALDDYIVEFRFAGKPGIDRWHYGVATASILPEHHWGYVFYTLAAGNERDPGLGLDAPSAGGYRFGARSSAGEWRWEAVEGWWNSAAQYTVYENGAVTYRNLRIGVDETYGAEPAGNIAANWVEGPYAGAVLWDVFGDQAEAMLAVIKEDADLVVGGIRRGLQVSQVPFGEGLVDSPARGLSVLRWNPTHPALATPQLRRALACFLILDFLTTNVLQGEAVRSGWVAPDLTGWIEDTLDDPCGVPGAGKVAEGVTRMVDAGWEWDTPPSQGRGGSFEPGLGLRHSEDLDLSLLVVAPTASQDPLRATTGLWVEGWLGALGFDVRLEQGTVDEFPDWDVAIVRTSRDLLPPRPDVPETSVTYTHLGAATVAEAMRLWSAVRDDLAAEALAVPLFSWRYTDFVDQSLVFPYSAVLGGYDPALIASALMPVS